MQKYTFCIGNFYSNTYNCIDVAIVLWSIRAVQVIGRLGFESPTRKMIKLFPSCGHVLNVVSST